MSETKIYKEKCPQCGYEMTKPFEYRCPICVKFDENVKLPINIEKLLSVKPLPEKPKDSK